MRKIKNRHVLVVGAGSTLIEYKDKIEEFIKNNNPIIVGCNHIEPIITPDYHFWTDKRRILKYGKHMNKKSTLIFGYKIDKTIIKKYWKSSYKIITYTQLKWKKSYEDPNSPKYGGAEVKYNKKTNIYHGVFRCVGLLALFWTYIQKAKKISVVGMDGYTLYSKEYLKQKKEGQQWYGKGFTDMIGNESSPKKIGNKTKYYNFATKSDEDNYKTLISLKKYGVKFEILTPTVYKKFYNSNILRI